MKKSKRGLTLVEAVVALLILATGLAALFGMITRVNQANESMALQTLALDAFRRITAQIQDARCDVVAQNTTVGAPTSVVDPGLNVPLMAWIAAPVPNSDIIFLGDGNTNPELANKTPRVRIDYRRTAIAQGVAGVPPTITFDVRVRELRGDAALDAVALENGYWIRIYPVQKLCNVRLDDTARGEYAP